MYDGVDYAVIARLANGNIRAFAGTTQDTAWIFFCECGCFTLVPMSLTDFDAGTGVWAAGHEPQLSSAP